MRSEPCERLIRRIPSGRLQRAIRHFDSGIGCAAGSLRQRFRLRPATTTTGWRASGRASRAANIMPAEPAAASRRRTGRRACGPTSKRRGSASRSHAAQPELVGCRCAWGAESDRATSWRRATPEWRRARGPAWRSAARAGGVVRELGGGARAGLHARRRPRRRPLVVSSPWRRDGRAARRGRVFR